MTGSIGRQLSDEYGIDKAWLLQNHIFDPTLDVDAPLFIDPFLLAHSKHKEFAECAFETYENHFAEIFALLRLSQNDGDKAWRAALMKFRLGEVKGMSGTCLGYSKHSTHGRGFGEKLSVQALKWAKEVIDLGVKDPELFSSLPLFEGGIGPDLISDMVANITLDCILSFNKRCIENIQSDLKIKLPIKNTIIQGRSANLIPNPHDNKGAPVILLASDILKYLPILDNPLALADIADHNAELRGRVNNHISSIFKIRYKKEKEAVKNQAMESAQSFQALLDLLKIAENTPYDIAKDPAGLMQWKALADQFSGIFKAELTEDKSLPAIERIDNVVRQVISKFKELVEVNRMSRVFFVDGNPRHERFAQLLFYSIAASYCDANHLDVSPECDAGAGPVDFKISSGSDKVVVEIKLSTNGKTVTGYRAQLDAYMQAEKAHRGHYVVIDVGKLGNKWKELTSLSSNNPAFQLHKQIHLIRGIPSVSASKLS